MVLLSNKRLRNAQSNDGKEYKLNGVVYKGSGNKAGSGATTGRPYNLNFKYACCKIREEKAVEVHQELVNKLQAMLARVKEMRVRAGVMNANDDVMDVKQVEGILVNTEYVRPAIVYTVPAAINTAELSAGHKANIVGVGRTITLPGVAANTDAEVVLAAAKAAVADADAAGAVAEVRGVVATMVEVMKLAQFVHPQPDLALAFANEKNATDNTANVV